MTIEDEAKLTAIELMRQTMAGSQFYRDYPPDDAEDYDAADAAMADAATEAMVDAQVEAMHAYLARSGDDVTLAVHTLAAELAKKAMVYLMLLMQYKLGHLPTKEELLAELESGEWFVIEGG